VSRPARYAGGEWNAVVKDWDAQEVRVALAYPDAYEVGMSNLGLAILYDILNGMDGVLAERVYAPWPDMESLLRVEGVPLFGLETRHPLSEFDVIGFSLSYEGTYSNVLTMLDLAGLPLRSAERDERYPLVIAGGTGALNPETLADFIDAFFLGDGEDAVVELAEVVREWKRQGGCPRAEQLRRLAAMPGVYVPSLYAPAYREDGTLASLRPVDPAARPVVTKRFLQALPPPPTRLIVPFMETVHDRVAIEIQRGCTQGCRFCQAGIVYRPRNERSPDVVIAAAREALAATGYDELTLVSLSSTDHSRIEEIVERLRAELGDGITISLPSMRVDSFSVRVADAVGVRGKHSLTFAPEAGSQRLRDAINKLVTDADVLSAAESAFARGWTSLKLYFMVGLPTETLDDVAGIASLAAQVRALGERYQGSRAKVRVSTSNFIPKPHTPFQWAGQAQPEALRERHRLLQRELKRARVAFSWEDPERSLLEAVLSRGDRRLGRAIERAWRDGARFDAWGEHYDWQRWQRALEAEGLDPTFYAQRERGLFEFFPWSHVNTGVTEAYLRGQWRKTLTGETTPDCHRADCNVCGMQSLEADDCLPRFAMLVERRREQRRAGVG